MFGNDMQGDGKMTKQVLKKKAWDKVICPDTNVNER